VQRRQNETGATEQPDLPRPPAAAVVHGFEFFLPPRVLHESWLILTQPVSKAQLDAIKQDFN